MSELIAAAALATHLLLWHHIRIVAGSVLGAHARTTFAQPNNAAALCHCVAVGSTVYCTVRPQATETTREATQLLCPPDDLEPILLRFLCLYLSRTFCRQSPRREGGGGGGGALSVDYLKLCLQRTAHRSLLQCSRADGCSRTLLRLRICIWHMNATCSMQYWSFQAISVRNKPHLEAFLPD